MKWNWWDLVFRRNEIIRQLEEKEKEIERKENELKEKENRLKKTIKQLKKKEEELDKKEKDIEEREKKVENEKQNIREERRQLRKQIQQLLREIQLLNKEREELQKEKEKIRNLKKNLKKKWKSLKKKAKEKIKKEREKWQQKKKELEETINKLQKKIIELEQEKETVFIPTADIPVKIVIISQNIAKTQIEFYVHSDYVGLIRGEIQQDLWGTEYMPTSDGFVWKFRIRTDAPKKKKKVEGEEGEKVEEEDKKLEGEGEVDMSETKALLQTVPDPKWFHIIRWLEDYRVEMTEEQYSLVSTVSGVAGWRLSPLFGQKYEIRYICPSARLSGFAEVGVYVGNEAIEESKNEEKEGEGE
jgi:myosin heavy subunit